MALNANALTTVANVKAEISNLTDTTVAENLINQASKLIEQYCRRPLVAQDIKERLRPPPGPRLVLKGTPLTEQLGGGYDITITQDGTAITDFTVEDPEAGIIYREGGWGCNELAVVSSLACDTIPGTSKTSLVVEYNGGVVIADAADLEGACVATVASLFRKRGVDLSAAYFDGANEAIGRALGGLIPGPCLPILRTYKRID